MAAFIVGLIGYGLSFFAIGCALLGLHRFQQAERHSFQERGYLIASGFYVLAAFVWAVLTHCFIKVAL